MESQSLAVVVDVMAGVGGSGDNGSNSSDLVVMMVVK